ncbi:MAG: glycosyltransferase [Gemmatimonadales bacterium]
MIVLHVGSCAPRKNIEAVIATVAELRRRGNTNAALVQVGGRFTPQQLHQIEELGLAGSVIQEQVASDAELIAAYNAANVLLLPSHYEGFGLPALEALAAGLPVVTSGVGGLAEAASDQAMVVNPPEPAGLADAIESLPTDSDLRVAEAERRRAWARQFSWNRSAEEHAKVYDELRSRA